MPDDIVYTKNLRVAITPQQLSQWTVEGARNAPGLAAYGPCPACDHECLVTLPLEFVTAAAGAGAAQPPPERATRKFRCTCSVSHPQRPAKVPGGCGRWFLAAVEPHDDGWAMSPETDESLLPALTAMEEAVAGEMSQVRASAEKWLPGIAALYGLFGLAGVLVGRDTVGSLAPGGKVTVAVLVLAGLGCTAGAIWYGYQAAYGWPRVVGASTDERLRSWYAERRKGVLAAPRLLRASVAAAVAALGCLLAAVLVIWFWPAATAASPVVTVRYQPAGAGGLATACGSLQASTGAGLTLSVRAGSGTQPLLIRAGAIRAVAPVTACPG